MSNQDLYADAWRYYFEKKPNILASWGHQNGRWPHYQDIPEWYDEHPEVMPKTEEEV